MGLGARRRLVAEPARSASPPGGRRAPGPGPAPRGAARLARKRASVSSAERRRSATGLPIRRLLDALPGLLGEPLAEVDDWRRTRWDALVMQAAMPDPRWMPGQAAGERLEPMPPGPDGIAANWPWTASRRCCCSARCPRRRCRWRRPGACWRACANQRRRLRDELQLGYALFCGFREVGARRGLLFAAQSPRACPERLLEHMETFLQRSVEALAQLPAQRLAGLREALADDCAERRVASPSEPGAPGRSTLAWRRSLPAARRGRPRPERRRRSRPRPGCWRRAAAGGCPAGAEASHAVTRRQPCRRHCGVRSKAALLRWRSRRDQGCATAGGALPAPAQRHPRPP